MAVSFEYETLEALLDKCTDPATGKEDWRYINAFCDRVNKDYDGPLISTRLIVRKLQTFDERTSLLALSVLETCVKSCGQKYHQEIGKFRFLNELIKLLSNKYDGPRTPQPVKHKIIEMFYSWSVGLPSETKVKEAYLMLKRQGVVNADPHLPSQIEPYKPTPQPRMAVFEDDEKSRLLARLLASKHPDDLQAANRLIKNMVKQDEIREEKLSLRVQELEMVQNNTKLLNDMLTHYSSNSPHSDTELMKELYDSCEKLRTDLFKLAGTATEEGDDTLSDILRANDDLAKVIDDYRRIVGVPGEPRTSTTTATSSTAQSSTPDLVQSSAASSNLSSLIDLDMSTSSQTAASTNGDILSGDLQDLVLGGPTPQQARAPQLNPGLIFPPVHQHVTGPRPQLAPWPNAAVSSGIPTASASVNTIRGAQPYSPNMPPLIMPPPRAPVMFSRPTQPLSPSGNTSWSANVVNRMKPEEPKPRQPSPLDLLGQEALTAHKESQNKPKVEEPIQAEKKDALLLDIGDAVVPQPTPQVTPSIPPPPAAVQNSNGKQANDTPLDQITLSMDKIKPGNLPPMNVLDKNDVKTVMHFAKDSSGSLRADIHVVVVTTMSTNTSPVKSFTFQCAAPKSMKLKLQPPTSNELPGYNPILPPSAITQVMLLSNPAKDRIRLKFRISYEINGVRSVETGDLENFPIL